MRNNNRKEKSVWDLLLKDKQSKGSKGFPDQQYRENEMENYDRNMEIASKKSIYKVIYIFVGLFVLMMGHFTYYLAVQSDDVINSTYNTRQKILTKKVVRGMIMSGNGKILAKTKEDSKGKESREYPYGDMFAHVVGRYSRGKAGLEESENIRLLTSNVNAVEKIKNDLSGDKSIGDNIITTLDTKLQKVAYDALGNNRGAVVVIEPTTGKILAMVSKPTYDPNVVDIQWDKLVEDKNKESALLNRATQGLYPPGSTFKTLTALEYIQENPTTYMNYEYYCDGSIAHDGMVIHCCGNETHGEVDLSSSYAESCNTSFATIGQGLDLDRFYNLCEKFLFNKSIPIEMRSKNSSFELQRKDSSVKETMQTAIGQGKTLITPLHNALIVSSVANDGIMMKPYVIDRIENAEGGQVEGYSPKEIGRVMTSEEADYLSVLMRGVVTDGTATKLKDLNVEAAGKTGSADQNGGKAHAWFIGYAPLNNPQIAVSIIVERAGTGGTHAVPIAKKIFSAYFK